MQKKVNSGWREGGEKVVIVIVNVKPRGRQERKTGWVGGIERRRWKSDIGAGSEVVGGMKSTVCSSSRDEERGERARRRVPTVHHRFPLAPELRPISACPAGLAARTVVFPSFFPFKARPARSFFFSSFFLPQNPRPPTQIIASCNRSCTFFTALATPMRVSRITNDLTRF